MASQLPPGTDLCQVPAGMPPDGVIPNLTQDAPLAPATIAVSTLLTTISVVLTAGRIWMNRLKLKAADFFAMAGLALDLVYTGLILAMTKYGRHQWDTPACWFTPDYMKILFVQGTTLGPVIFFAKGAILLLYLQIFSSHKPMRMAVYIGLIITGLTYWPSVPIEIAFAAPRPGQHWSDLMTDGNPSKTIYWGIVQGSLAVFIDLYIFVLPLPVLWGLHMSLKRRIGLCAVFFTALMGVVASVIALVFRVKLLQDPDTQWIQSQLFICIVVENNVAMIVSSVPAFKNFMTNHVVSSDIFKSLTSKLSGSTSHSSKIDSNKMPSNDSASEASLRVARSYEFSNFSRPVTQIEGGRTDPFGNPGFVEDNTQGIIQKYDITQEVKPHDRV